MNPSIVSAIIAGCVTLLGIWLTNYLAIRRELLFRGVPAQQPAIPELQGPDQRVRVVVPVSRKTLLSDWRRSLLAVALCPVVNLVAVAAGVVSYYGFWPYIEAKALWETLLTVGPWFYATCIIILFPLLVFVYRRVTRQRARLIFAVLTWCIHSSLFFLVSSSGGAPIGNADLMIAAIGGTISGLVYWLITRTSFPHRNVSAGNRVGMAAL